MNGLRIAKGQALVEVLVAATFVVTLLMATVWLARLIELRQTMTESVQAAGFECVHFSVACTSTAAQSSIWVRRHFGGDRRMPLAMDRRANSIQDDSWARPTWNAGSTRAVLNDYSDVSMANESGRFDSVARVLARNTAAGALQALAHAGPRQFGLSIEGGLVRTALALQTPIPFVSNNERLTWAGRYVVLADDWSATGGQALSETVRRGQEPDAANQVARLWYAPSMQLLMPISQVLGLDRNVEVFQSQFHRIDANLPIQGRYR